MRRKRPPRSLLFDSVRAGALCLLALLGMLSGCDAVKKVAATAGVGGEGEADAAQAAPQPADPTNQAASPETGASTAASASHTPPASENELPWSEILDSSRAVIPPPRPELTWFESLPEALAVARAERRPVFLTLRCPETESFRELDDAVLNGSGELGEQLRQFITVRLTNLNDVDLRYFSNGEALPHRVLDMDLAWIGACYSDAGQYYGFIGGRDIHGDDTRISPPAVAAALKRVLAHHYDPRRASWNIDPQPVDAAGPANTVQSMPGYNSWLQHLPAKENNGCIRCHHLIEIHHQPYLEKRTLDKRRLMMWPLPEGLGLTLDRDDGLLVREVAPDSIAGRMGILPGDVLAAASDGRRWKRLISQGDLQSVLEQGRSTSSVSLVWLRNGQVMHGDEEGDSSWTASPLTWRRSIIYGNIGADPGFFPRQVKDSVRRSLKVPAGTMLVQPEFGADPKESVPYQLGLRPDNLIVSVNGEKIDLSNEDWILWFRQTFEPNRPVTLQVKVKKDLKAFIYTPTGRY